jgi:hypothetical protein
MIFLACVETRDLIYNRVIINILKGIFGFFFLEGFFFEDYIFA